MTWFINVSWYFDHVEKLTEVTVEWITLVVCTALLLAAAGKNVELEFNEKNENYSLRDFFLGRYV